MHKQNTPRMRWSRWNQDGLGLGKRVTVKEFCPNINPHIPKYVAAQSQGTADTPISEPYGTEPSSDMRKS